MDINWETFFFLLFALVACSFAVAVVVSSNIVRMAFYLILSLGATSGLFFLAGADFVGAMQLMIYVGGTLVLLIFGVMLTAQGPFISLKTRGGEWVMAAIVGGSLLVVLVQQAVSIDDWLGPNAAPVQTGEGGEQAAATKLVDTRTATRLGMALAGPRVDQFDEPDPLLRGGMSSYVLPFEIVSVHLLVVLVGAAYLARTKRRAR